MKKERTRKPLTLKQRHNRVGYIFLSIWLIGFLVFTFFPVLFTIFLSFNSVIRNVFGYAYTFIGITNYFVALFQNTTFLPLLIQFFVMELTYVPAILVLSFILAMLLNQNIKFRSVFRVIYFFPVIVLSGPVIDQLVSSNGTELADISNNFIIKMITNYSPELADAIIGLFNNFSLVLWFTGIPIILFLNGLQKINPQLYEAANLDGATAWQSLWKITVPLMKSTALVSAIFVVVQLATYSINPLYSFVISVLSTNWTSGLGFAAAISLLFSLVVFIFVGIAFWLFSDHEKEYRYEDVLKMQALKLEKLQRRHRRQQMTWKQRTLSDLRSIGRVFKRKEG